MLVRTACWPQIPCVPHCHIVISDIWCNVISGVCTVLVHVLCILMLTLESTCRSNSLACTAKWSLTESSPTIMLFCLVCLLFLLRCVAFVLFLCLVMLLGEFVPGRLWEVGPWGDNCVMAGGSPAAWDIRSERTYSWKQESRCWFQRLLIFTLTWRNELYDLTNVLQLGWFNHQLFGFGHM